MGNKTNLVIGMLFITLLASGIIITLDQFNVKMRCDDDKCTFYVKNENNRWIVSGREFNKLYSGSSLQYRSAKDIELVSHFDPNKLEGYVVRTTPYQNGAVIVDTYKFEGDIDKVEDFPIYHTVEIYNASGMFYRWEVRDLDYNGPSEKLFTTKQKFGLNMTATWDDGYRWARVYSSGILKVQYKIESDYEFINVRLFDPPSLNWSVLSHCHNITGYVYTNDSRMILDNVSNTTWQENYSYWDSPVYTPNTGCSEVGVFFNGTYYPFKQGDRNSIRDQTIVCQWLTDDGGVNIEVRSVKNETTNDDSESGVCVDLADELIRTSQSNGVIFQ